jgi:hypothetical protein
MLEGKKGPHPVVQQAGDGASFSESWMIKPFRLIGARMQHMR